MLPAICNYRLWMYKQQRLSSERWEGSLSLQ